MAGYDIPMEYPHSIRGRLGHKSSIPLRSLSAAGYRGLWRGSATHAAASIFGGFARLSALRRGEIPSGYVKIAIENGH